MASGEKRVFSAVECAGRAGKYAFGLDQNKTVELLRTLADDVEAGRVMLHALSTSTHATQDEFTIRELVIEILEEIPEIASGSRKPLIIKD